MPAIMRVYFLRILLAIPRATTRARLRPCFVSLRNSFFLENGNATKEQKVMLFNSLPFLVFFPLVCAAYWLLPCRWRNIMLLMASYYFYMNWEPVYALLIMFTTVSTWWCALMMQRSDKHRGTFLTASLIINLMILFIYKYLGFVTESVFHILRVAGLRVEMPHFELLLPVGISFYTFQAIGYTIDVYRRTIKAERDLATYALFVSFFPQLVAGPIERAKNLLAQFHERHVFNGDKVIDGIKLMTWGYFMKLCVAENVAPYVNAVYNNLPNHTGTSVLLATIFFTFQIFCDFGGYSLIAIGAAKCMGFSLMQNFNHPYLSRSVKDFWRRWHISLSSWFTEYVYIPLGGNRHGGLKHVRNLFATMLISGVWHGAGWTFILWGGLHGLFLVVHTIKTKYIKALAGKKLLPPVVNIFFTFILVMLGWIFFRANTIEDAFLAINKIVCQPGQLYNGEGKPTIMLNILLITILMFKEIKDEYGWPIHLVHSEKRYISIISMALLIIVIMLCAQFEGGQFIYFQF